MNKKLYTVKHLHKLHWGGHILKNENNDQIRVKTMFVEDVSLLLQNEVMQKPVPLIYFFFTTWVGPRCLVLIRI